ncbi:MAG TPA: hypothetical protein VHB30_13495 [Solirubrobacteraceae bacterium]|nr:hypothetical protein [Solirubrobacteraceae bacterium]
MWRVGAPPERLRDEQRRERRRPKRPPQPPAELPEGSEHVDTTA